MQDAWTIPTITAETALRDHAEGRRALVDLRRAEARATSGERVVGVPWIDPEALDHRHPLTGAEGPLAVFCVAGHEVSHFACALLMMHGRDVRLVTGGFEALGAAGARLAPLSAEPTAMGGARG